MGYPHRSHPKETPVLSTHFGEAEKYSPDSLPADFIVDFGDRLATRGGTSGFVLELADLRSRTLGEPSQVGVAGHDLDPGVGDANQRPLQILIGKPNRFEHRPCRRSIRPIQQYPAV